MLIAMLVTMRRLHAATSSGQNLLRSSSNQGSLYQKIPLQIINKGDSRGIEFHLRCSNKKVFGGTNKFKFFFLFLHLHKPALCILQH